MQQVSLLGGKKIRKLSGPDGLVDFPVLLGQKIMMHTTVPFLSVRACTLEKMRSHIILLILTHITNVWQPVTYMLY